MSHRWLPYVRLHVVKSTFTPSGIKVSPPKHYESASINFKDDYVTHYRHMGNRVIYIGDARGDYSAARASDFAFAIRGSRLATICREDGVSFRETSDFHEVIEMLQK